MASRRYIGGRPRRLGVFGAAVKWKREGFITVSGECANDLTPDSCRATVDGYQHKPEGPDAPAVTFGRVGVASVWRYSATPRSLLGSTTLSAHLATQILPLSLPDTDRSHVLEQWRGGN